MNKKTGASFAVIVAIAVAIWVANQARHHQPPPAPAASTASSTGR
jgi:hypothetical protein